MSEVRPPCFGIPDQCMPVDENGVIQPQENCRPCPHLRECLRAAIAARGGVQKVRSAGNSLDNETREPGGIVGAILRWSARKHAAQKNGTS
ncbi:MAG: hypothetical protein ACLFVT_10055 [Syntrophobacteria bacterium]